MQFYRPAVAQKPHASAGFTFIELLVAIGMIVILAAILIPYLLNVRETAHRIECASHLRLIGAALRQYARDGGDRPPFPQVVYDAVHKPTGYVAFTGPDAVNPFAANSAVQPNDITASLWLLVRGGYIKDLSDFICPSTWDESDTLTDSAGAPVAAQARGNFRSPLNLSYSYACPFAKDFDGQFSSDSLPAEFVVMADKNPGFPASADEIPGPARDAPPFERAKGNSKNHDRGGQNVLHTAGDVSFEDTPYCGVAHDNIYTALAPAHITTPNLPLDSPGYFGPTLGPAHKYDTYLIPAASEPSP